MGFFGLILAVVLVVLPAAFWRLMWCFWVSPMRAYRKLRNNGFKGPEPRFPMGNLPDMRKVMMATTPPCSDIISHDIHSSVFPYFSQWQNSYGKVFIYWLGTEPFLYIADPEFLKIMSAGVMGKTWGKPDVFKRDRKPMFGNGLVMVEGDDWVRHRHVITPAFSHTNLKAMTSLMVESTTNMLDKWTSSGEPEIDVEKEITLLAGEIIAKTSFGISYGNGRKVFEKLRTMQTTLFKSNKFLGVPFGKLMDPKQSLKAKMLGEEIDGLLMKIITDRKRSAGQGSPPHDLLGMLLKENHVDGKLGKTLTTREMVDECKTFFFGGHETTALALTWTLLLLAEHPTWQDQLREEIKEVVGDKEIDSTMLGSLKKMSWVMNEVLRLYPPAPNVQRQAREDIKVGDLTIPNGTNVWIDVVSMNHDPELWGADVHKFRPERFRDDNLYGGCKHKMGYVPFGFGGRMCVGRNLTMMEYRVVLTLILSRFSFSVSQTYRHSPSILLSLRPTHGLPLIVRPL